MATIRELKKAVDDRVYLVLLDCETRVSRSSDHRTEVLLLASDVIEFEKEMMKKINAHGEITPGKERREYFRSLRAELDETVKGFFTRLSEIIRQ
jgi:hypothetical protein